VGSHHGWRIAQPVCVVFMVWFIGWSMCGTMRSSTSKLDIGRIESGDGIAAGLSMPAASAFLRCCYSSMRSSTVIAYR
jgi:hypothetical protein